MKIDRLILQRFVFRNGQDGSSIPFLPGEIIVEPEEFIEPPIVESTITGGIQFKGKKSSGASGKFIYDVGQALPDTQYTLRYDPDWSQLANNGVTAMVGFGLKQGNSFRLSGLRGDGGAGIKAFEVSGTNWNQTSGFTDTDGGAAAHGTQDGPNWLRFTVSADGNTYTLSSSADGESWTEEFSDVVPTPHADVDGVPVFGIAVFLQAADAGNFTVAVTLWTSEAAEEPVGVLAGTIAFSFVPAAILSSTELWTFEQLSPVMWHKADEITGSDGDDVSTFEDASGNDRDWGPHAIPAPPNLEIAEQNGLNVLRFTKASSERLQSLNLSGLGLTAGTVFYLVKYVNEGPAHDNPGPAHFGTHADSNHTPWTDGNIYNGDLSTVRKANGNPTPAMTDWNIVCVTSTAGQWRYWLNDVALNDDPVNTFGLAQPTLGVSANQYGDFFWAEDALISGVVSEADRNRGFGYLAHKWGIASVLAAEHPYKSDAPTLEEEPTISTVYDIPVTSGDAGWAGYNIIHTIAAGNLDAPSVTGPWARLTLEFTTFSSGAVMSSMYFKKQGSSLVQVPFAGIGSITGDGTTLVYVSDWFQLAEDFDEATNYDVTLHFNGGGTVDLGRNSGGAVGNSTSYKFGADEAAAPGGGYTFHMSNSMHLVTKIEIATAAKVLSFMDSEVSASDLTTYTFSGKDIGIAAADRRVIVAITGTQSSTLVSSVTIGGVTADQIINTMNGTVTTVALFMALVPNGTTADVVVTFAAGQSRCGIGVWSCTGLTSNVAHATAISVNGTNPGDIDLALATLDGGFVIVYGSHHNAQNTSHTITYSPAAISHRFRETIEATVIHYGGAGATDGTTFDITTGDLALIDFNMHAPIIAASF